VNSHHPQKVTKFCKKVVDQCNYYHLAERVATLHALDCLESHHLDELEQIDAQLTRILVSEDRKCTPKNQVAWSPELNRAYLSHRFWSISLTAKRTKWNLEHVLNGIKQRFNPLEEDPQAAQRSISTNLCLAQKALRKAKKEANQLRRQHLETALNAARASNQTKKSKALLHLISAEQNKRCYNAF